MVQQLCNVRRVMAVAAVLIVVVAAWTAPAMGGDETYWNPIISAPGQEPASVTWGRDRNWSDDEPTLLVDAYVGGQYPATVGLSGDGEADHLTVGTDPVYGGTVIVESAGLLTRRVTLGDEGFGLFRQTGGTTTITGSFRIGSNDTGGRFEMVDGLHTSLGAIEVGRYGEGDIVQVGGELFGMDYMSVGYEGLYDLRGGDLITNDIERIYGVFIQSGGLHRVRGELAVTTRPWIAGITPGRYDLSAGTLDADAVTLGRSSAVDQLPDGGLFAQSGGIHRVGYLQIVNEGRYELSGGLLQINGGLELAGAFDCMAEPVHIDAGDNTIINITGDFFKAGRASLSVGANSLVIHEPGVHPSEWFDSFSTAGRLHELGTTLTVSNDQSIGGWGTLADRVECEGVIAATAGGKIDLLGGLYAADATIDLGTGTLRVNHPVSEAINTIMGDTELTLGRLEVARAPDAGSPLVNRGAFGDFIQTSGRIVASEVLLAYNKGTVGT